MLTFQATRETFDLQEDEQGEYVHLEVLAKDKVGARRVIFDMHLDETEYQSLLDACIGAEKP